jgi:hypothetical protein
LIRRKSNGDSAELWKFCDPAPTCFVCDNLSTKMASSSENNLESGMCSLRYQLHFDGSERDAALLGHARACDEFDVQVVHLAVGDYLIDGGEGGAHQSARIERIFEI